MQKNFRRWTALWRNLFEVKIPSKATASIPMRARCLERCPISSQSHGRDHGRLRGDLPVSALPMDGTYPVGTAQWEKRNIALEGPSGKKTLHPMRQMRHRLSSCHDPLQNVSAGVLERCPRRLSSQPPPKTEKCRAKSIHYCKWRPKIAPDADSASMSVPPRTN